MRHLLCLFGLHRYRKPTHIGGMRCECGRVRYQLQWWAPAAGGMRATGPGETGTPHALALAHLAELGLLGGANARLSPGCPAEGQVNIVILPLANKDDMHRSAVPAGRDRAGHVIDTGRPAGLALVHDANCTGPASP